MSASTPTTGLRGYLLHAPTPKKIETHADGALVWDAAGVLTYAGSWAGRPKVRGIAWKDYSGHILTPGFVDVHAHIPQYPVVARDGLPLLPWLNKYIFPTEKAFTPKVAAKQAPQFFDALKANGITSAALYTSVNAKSTGVCFQAAEASGLRIVTGQMMMDVNSYADGTGKELLASTLKESEALCARWHGAAKGRLRYAYSPRFAVTCSVKMMQGAAQLAAESGAFIQTHLAENRQELQVVHDRFPWSEDYVDVYESCNLLGPRTIVGHAIYLNARELRALAVSDTKIAHCPSSNLFLQSGVLPWDKFKNWNLQLGLASDVAGGPELNPWEVLKAASYSHKARYALKRGPQPPTLAELFHTATVGGSRVLDQAETTGQLKAGFAADVVAWNVEHVAPVAAGKLTTHSPEEILALLVHRGGAGARVENLWVQGGVV
jgi:guanine deaminase